MGDNIVGRGEALRTVFFFLSTCAAVAADNSTLSAKFDAAGKVTAVTIAYPRDYVKQQLGYAGLYGVQ